VDLTLGLQLLGLVVLLALSAFFSSSETSLFSLDRTQIERLKREKHPRAALIERLLSRPRQLLVTILIGNELVNVSATVLSAVIIVRLVGAELSWINVFVMVPVLLLFGEITPKTLAIGHNVGFASFQSVLIDRFARLIGPVRWVVRRVSEFFITMIVGEERTAANIATEDMVRVLAAEAVGEGVIDASEAKYIHQVFNFGDKMVRDIATQRSRLFMLPVGMPLAQMAIEIDITRHTKVPVHEDGDKDAILGVLFARDLLGLNLQETDREAVVKLVRNAHFVPDTLSAASLFVTFRSRRLSLALTVDEFGGITGLVTMEDLLECIFGEIESGSERRRRQRVVFEKLGDGRFRMDARMTVRQFNELLGCDLGDERSETIGGILLSEFGHLPDEGSKVRIDGIELTVVSVSGQRIANILVEPSPEAPAADETAPAELVAPSERTEG
jgi:putative hemolysin